MIETETINAPDGMLILVKRPVAPEAIDRMRRELAKAMPYTPFVIMNGESLDVLDEAEMNRHGWYRRPNA